MADTRYKKGMSGNPAGRPAGKTPGAQIRKVIETRKDEILQAVIDAAIAGDMQACKMLLDRITPPLKPVAEQFPLPMSDDGAGLSEQGAAVVKAALSGHIPPDIGSQLIATLVGQSKIIEIDELTKRVEALETRQ